MESSSASGLNAAQLSAIWQELQTIAAGVGAPSPTIEGAARLLGKSGITLSEFTETIDSSVDEAITAFESMRVVEGSHLQTVLNQRLGLLESFVSQVQAVSVKRLPQYRERLIERVTEALADRTDLDQATIVRECAIYSDRIDISEEVDRLDSHRAQFSKALEAEGPIGRKLEFILQEIGREINTIGSKSNDAELTAVVVEAKGIAEQMREQALNVL